MNAAMPPAFCAFATACSAKRGLSATLRSVYLDDAAARQAAEAQRHVQRDRTGRDHLDRHSRLLAEAHDRALAELPLDLEESGLQGLLPVARPLRARLAVYCHGGLPAGFRGLRAPPAPPRSSEFRSRRTSPGGHRWTRYAPPPTFLPGTTRRLARGDFRGRFPRPFEARNHCHLTTIERTCIRSWTTRRKRHQKSGKMQACAGSWDLGRPVPGVGLEPEQAEAWSRGRAGLGRVRG